VRLESYPRIVLILLLVWRNPRSPRGVLPRVRVQIPARHSEVIAFEIVIGNVIHDRLVAEFPDLLKDLLPWLPSRPLSMLSGWADERLHSLYQFGGRKWLREDSDWILEGNALDRNAINQPRDV
jgi:hypothetical protein